VEAETKNLNYNSLTGQHQPSISRAIRPYLFISLAGILAFAPLSFMLKSLKNDIVAIEYPINYFISQCIHNAEVPYWFNTWGMGFPLQSGLTWSFFSTPQMLFSALFDYNIYILHIEFMFFLLLAGWSMFYLLKKYLLQDEKIALLLAICYMLSGFMVGSTQWLLYITAASFLPLVIISLLKLLHFPSVKNALQLALVYTMMVTSVYAAFNIITTYSLAVFIVIYLLQKKNGKRASGSILAYLLLAAIFTLVFCAPCLYYTVELLNYIDRGDSISGNTTFFNSNYLHPTALSSMLFPFSSVRMNFPNTEGTMLNTYAGLFVLLLLPAAIVKTVKEKNRKALLVLAASVLFLFFSFGGITPFRNALNIFPGFSYFRNPAIFRFYFLISLIVFLGVVFRNTSFENLFNFKDNRAAKILRYTILLLAIVCLVSFLANINQLATLSFTSLTVFIKNINYGQALLVSSFIQLLILGIVWLAANQKRLSIIKWLLISDLVINTLLCTPFFSVSSYSLQEVNNILHSEKGFPLQDATLTEARTTLTDEKKNTWYNVNVFSKEVSSNESYRGPLTLKDFSHFAADSSLFNKPLVFAEQDINAGGIKLLVQRPGHVSATVNFTAPGSLTLLQNYYPGWKAFYNDKKVEFINTGKPGMTISIPAGQGIIDFRYERKDALIVALLLHLIIIGFFLWRGYNFIKRKFFRPSSLS
jgi:hypothetical protein